RAIQEAYGVELWRHARQRLRDSQPAPTSVVVMLEDSEEERWGVVFGPADLTDTQAPRIGVFDSQREAVLFSRERRMALSDVAAAVADSLAGRPNAWHLSAQELSRVAAQRLVHPLAYHRDGEAVTDLSV